MKKKVTFLPLKNHFSLSQFTWLSCLETCFLVGTTSIRQSGTQGALTGVGLSIGYPTVIDESSAGLVVISSTPGTPTSRAGIMSRDIILAIDGINTGTMGIYDAAERLQREKVSLNPVKSRLCEVAAGGKGTSRIGYIKLTTFNQNASNVVKDAIETLRRNNVNAFVLDLHDNRDMAIAFSKIRKIILLANCCLCHSSSTNSPQASHADITGNKYKNGVDFLGLLKRDELYMTELVASQWFVPIIVAVFGLLLFLSFWRIRKKRRWRKRGSSNQFASP